MARRVTNAEINETFIIEPMYISGGNSDVVSACTAFFANELIACSGDTVLAMSIGEIQVSHSVVPMLDGFASLGTPIKRFRQLNTLSGSSTYWESQTLKVSSLSANTINLGFDLANNSRILTAESSVFKNDILDSGTY